MQAIFEPIFDIYYLTTVYIISIRMMKHATNKQYKVYGQMCFLLAFGDSFHLIPRILALSTNGFEAYTIPLGIGKFITSITMTIFYVVLYKILCMRSDCSHGQAHGVLIIKCSL